MRTRIETLDNGMKVAVYPFPGLYTVGISAGVKYGSVDDVPRGSHKAHFLEHLLFKGTKKRKWADIDEHFREKGIRHNAMTMIDSTAFVMQSYSSHLEYSMEFLSDLVTNSTIPEEEFEKEKSTIMNEIAMRSSRLTLIVYQAMPHVLFGDTSMKGILEDDTKQVTPIGRKDIVTTYTDLYGPANAALAVYGNVKPAEAVKFANKYFGRWDNRAKPMPRRPADRTAPKSSEMVLIKSHLKESGVGIGFRTAPKRPDNYAETLTGSLLTMLMRYKLWQEVRQKHGISYSPTAYNIVSDKFGFFCAIVPTEKPQNTGKVRDIITKELEKFEGGEISKKELAATAEQLRISYLMSMEDTFDAASDMAEMQVELGDGSLYESRPEMIKKISLDDARRYCERYIDLDRAGCVIAKPK